MNIKKNLYEERLKIGEEKSSSILRAETTKLRERLRSKSQERLKKTSQALLMTEEELENRRNKLLKKYEGLDKRIEENKESIKQELEMKKHKEILKEFNKEWNLMREKKKNEYQKELIKKKIEIENKRIRESNEIKKFQSEIKMSLINQELYNREILKEIVYKMAVTKKWNKKRVDKILAENFKLDSINSHLGSMSIPEAPSPNSALL